MLNLGTVAVGDYTGQVLFQAPADDGKGDRVTVMVPKPNEMAAIDSGRLDMWLFARGGKAVAVRSRTATGALIEVISAGATANAVYFFADADRATMAAVAVFVDGAPTVLKIPTPVAGQLVTSFNREVGPRGPTRIFRLYAALIRF